MKGREGLEADEGDWGPKVWEVMNYWKEDQRVGRGEKRREVDESREGGFQQLSGLLSISCFPSPHPHPRFLDDLEVDGAEAALGEREWRVKP